MTLLFVAIGLTVGLSFLCSLAESLILSTTVAEVEALKKIRPRRGATLEKLKMSMEETVSAILTLNTTVNTLGSVVIGGLATDIFGHAALGVIAAVLIAVILIFAEFLPKSLGVSYRRDLQPFVVYPLWTACRALRPITYVSNAIVRFFVARPPDEKQSSDEEIILLAERGAQQGTLTANETSIITNALTLNDVRVSEIMTPRTVVTALRKTSTVGEVFREYPNIPFGRMPVYGRGLDDIVGLARRRDLLKAKALDQDLTTVEAIMQEAHFIPETVTAENALQVFLKTHQQLLVVVDEFGSTAGVVTMEDVMEQILGREIFEKDDIAVDMRELARARLQRQARGRRPGEGSITPFTPTPKA